jgi:hypothetical protein
MYLAQYLVEGLFTWDDLPDELEYRRPILTKQLAKVNPRPSPEGGVIYYEGVTDEDYIYLMNPGETTPNTCPSYSGLQTGNIADWNGGPGIGGLSTNCCLIDRVTIFDKFADSYTVISCSEPSAIGTILTRTSLCYWEGQYNTPFAGTQTVSIFYCPSVGPIPSDVCNDTFKFYSFYSRDVGGLTDPIIAEKTPHSNTPSGNYTAENGSISFA